VVWWAVVFAIGLAVLYRRKARPLALACLALYVAVVMVAAGVMALTGGTV
jgi:arginine exporter protein ArgO